MSKEGSFKLLNIMRPAMAILPEVATPERKIIFKTRALWTVIVILIYLVCC